MAERSEAKKREAKKIKFSIFLREVLLRFAQPFLGKIKVNDKLVTLPKMIKSIRLTENENDKKCKNCISHASFITGPAFLLCRI